MPESCHFTRVIFKNYKVFKQFSVTLKDFNVLVGPNNCGKSTILGAFRILSEGCRRARARKPEIVRWGDRGVLGYSLSLPDFPIATENVFTDYDDSEVATVTFCLSNGNRLQLVFPEREVCYLICETVHRQVRSPTTFIREFNISLGFVPVLGPVEHNEQLYQKEAARLALLTHRASRNFRNIWYHLPEDFDTFQNLIQTTWPGMDIEQPTIDYSHDKPRIYMFAPENRIPREIFWAGFGFQVWCQMLTHIVKSKASTLLIIDEPDIYLHSDLQRRLISILKGLGPNILLATHSTEIISEVEPNDLLVIENKRKGAKRIKEYTGIQKIFDTLGTSLNPTLTQLAKSRKVVFVEGQDFKILSGFAKKLRNESVSNRTNFVIIPVGGFNPQKVKNLAEGIEKALGTTLLKGVILDRDYRSVIETEEILEELRPEHSIACIHNRKELENFLLEPISIERAVRRQIANRLKRTGFEVIFNEEISNILNDITEPLKNKIQAQFLAKWNPFIKKRKPHHDGSTINELIMTEFEQLWNNFGDRMRIVPGKDVFSLLNDYLQQNFKISITHTMVIDSFQINEIPQEMVELVNNLHKLNEARI